MKGLSFRARILLGLTLGFMAWLFQLGPAGQSLEQKGLDLLFLLRGPLTAPEDIVIVAVDEPSFAELGLQWPWPRSLHAKLIDRLSSAGARVIAFDILFAEPSVAGEDAALAQAIARAGNVVLASDFRVMETRAVQQALRVGPLPMFERAAVSVGAVNLVQERDRVIRKARLSVAELPTFARAIAQRAGWPNSDPDARVLINFLGPSPSIRMISYMHALNLDDVPQRTFDGKIVLVGRAVGAAGGPVDDSHFTPYFWQGRRLTPGVEIHAHIVDTLLRGRAIQPVGPLGGVAWIVALSLLAGILFGGLGPWAGLGVLLGLVVADSGLALAAFAGPSIWMPWLSPVLAMSGAYGASVVVRWRQSEREKTFVRRAFQHYVHPVVVQEIMEHPEELRLGGASVESTVLFSDLKGFTHMAEGFSATELVAFLNDYFSAMTEEILAHHGMLNRTIGDGILALWGAPLSNPDHPLDACKAALAMQQRLASLNEGWVADGKPSLGMRIGIQTGEIVVGNIGSRERFDYTAMGDNVNLASRLEGVNKIYGTAIIVGEDTARRVEDALELRELDRVRVVGKIQPVRIYECLGERGELSADIAGVLNHFRMGLLAYDSRDWAKAVEHFEQSLDIAPSDGPSRLYLDRCRHYLSEPPPKDWDGVYIATAK